MTELTAREGYAGTTIAGVIARAGVSRPTFYEYFSDKDACFEAALVQASSSLNDHFRNALIQAAPGLPDSACISACVSFAQASPVQARLLLCESLAGGPRSLDQRDSLVSSLASAMGDARQSAHPDTATPDLPPHIVLATAFWLLARALRLREPVAALEHELHTWVSSYSAPTASHRFPAIALGPAPPESPFVSSLPTEAPGVLPPGRPRLSRGEVMRNQRERILHATAKVAFEEGFNATSVTEIAAAAGVDPRVFYSHFPDKLSAFLAAHELGFEHTMAVSAGAFFSAQPWPERVRQGILAGTQFQATHPMLTHMLYVQSYAIGSAAIPRIEDAHSAFGLFLQEGNEQGPETRTPAVLRAVIAASFEIAFHLSRTGRGAELPRAAPLMTYLCLAPFLGPDAATEFVFAHQATPA